MDVTSVVGLIVAFGMILLGYKFEHGYILSLLKLSPALIVLGGTFGALMISYTSKEIKKIPSLFKRAFTSQKINYEYTIEILVSLANTARKEGLLSLEGYFTKNHIEDVDEILMEGVQLVVDGENPDSIREMLETAAHTLFQERKKELSLFESAGGFAPTMGILGTVMALVQALGNLSTAGSDSLGSSISSAFIATLYGVGFANLIFLPIADKLRLKTNAESLKNEIIIEGVLLIQSGENVKMLQKKLEAFLAPENTNTKAEAVKGT